LFPLLIISPSIITAREKTTFSAPSTFYYQPPPPTILFLFFPSSTSSNLPFFLPPTRINNTSDRGISPIFHPFPSLFARLRASPLASLALSKDPLSTGEDPGTNHSPVDPPNHPENHFWFFSSLSSFPTILNFLHFRPW
jgi:hypothetical protein